MFPNSQSIPLLTIHQQTNKFTLTEQAAQYLKQLNRPVAIVTIAGLYRTGKSFLVNRLIRNKESEGFRVGSTTNSVTKGLNIWGSPITLLDEKGEKIDYLLIDSEGIGSCQQQTKHDTNLLILIFLISSTVIYNTLNAIDEMGLQQLQVVLKLKKCLQVQSLYNPSPKFVWVLRDFSLQLIDEHGNEMTPNQYLQKCLEFSNSKNHEARKKNEIRQAIKDNLKNRTCYTLVRPTTKEEDLNNLNSYCRTQKQCHKIRTEFLGQIQQLKQQIFSGSSSDIKIINGKKLTGLTLYKVLTQYIQIINQGQLPNVSDVWDSIVKTTNAELFQQSIKNLKEELKRLKLPLSKQQLKLKLNQIGNRHYQELQNSLTVTASQFTSESIYKSHHKQFIRVMQKLSSDIKNRNDELKNNQTLSQLRQFVRQNVEFDKISPLNVASILKNLIERMKIKTNGYGEGYQYLLSVINDVLYIVEQKANKSERELCQYRLIMEKQQSEKKHQDLVLINMKKQYHESLKTIAKLQQGQAQIDKDYSLLRNRAHQYEKKFIEIQEENRQLRQQLQRLDKNLNEKLRKKQEEFTETVGMLRDQNNDNIDEIQRLKEKAQRNQRKQRKQIIFSEKIEASYRQFQVEKQDYINQISECKNQIRSITEKYEQAKERVRLEVLQKQKLTRQLENKQVAFKKQFQNLRMCVQETKNSHQLTHKTQEESTKVFRDIENLTSTKKNTQGQSGLKEQANEKDRQLMKNYYENRLNKQKTEYEEQIESIQERVRKIEENFDSAVTQKQILMEENRELKGRCSQLHQEILSANQKFSTCIQEIQRARESQRTLYEDSVMRLVKNIEKKKGIDAHEYRKQSKFNYRR